MADEQNLFGSDSEGSEDAADHTDEPNGIATDQDEVSEVDQNDDGHDGSGEQVFVDISIPDIQPVKAKSDETVGSDCLSVIMV